MQDAPKDIIAELAANDEAIDTNMATLRRLLAVATARATQERMTRLAGAVAS